MPGLVPLSLMASPNYQMTTKGSTNTDLGRSIVTGGSVSGSRGYFELRIRVRYSWLIVTGVMAIMCYPVLLAYTAFSMQYHETHGPSANDQKLWEATGCPSRIKGRSEDPGLNAWATSNRWKRLLMLDDSYLAINNQDILNDPACVGARIRVLVAKPGPWRYDIVDTKNQSVIVSIVRAD